MMQTSGPFRRVSTLNQLSREFKMIHKCSGRTLQLPFLLILKNFILFKFLSFYMFYNLCSLLAHGNMNIINKYHTQYICV